MTRLWHRPRIHSPPVFSGFSEDSFMHTFLSGNFEGLTVEQAMLRDAPRLYEIMKWAHEKRILRLKNALQDFNILRQKLRRAPVTANCAQLDCQRAPCSMTFPVYRDGCNLPSPSYWCDKHEPLPKSGMSQKWLIDFDAIRLMTTMAEKETLFKELKLAFGIPQGTRITKQFAHGFFANLEYGHAARP